MIKIKNQNLRNFAYWAVKIYIPNLILALYVLGLLAFRENIEHSTYIFLIAGMLVYFLQGFIFITIGLVFFSGIT
jgi:hypothetical protein